MYFLQKYTAIISPRRMKVTEFFLPRKRRDKQTQRNLNVMCIASLAAITDFNWHWSSVAPSLFQTGEQGIGPLRARWSHVATNMSIFEEIMNYDFLSFSFIFAQKIFVTTFKNISYALKRFGTHLEIFYVYTYYVK